MAAEGRLREGARRAQGSRARSRAGDTQLPRAPAAEHDRARARARRGGAQADTTNVSVGYPLLEGGDGQQHGLEHVRGADLPGRRRLPVRELESIRSAAPAAPVSAKVYVRV